MIPWHTLWSDLDRVSASPVTDRTTVTPSRVGDSSDSRRPAPAPAGLVWRPESWSLKQPRPLTPSREPRPPSDIVVAPPAADGAVTAAAGCPGESPGQPSNPSRTSKMLVVLLDALELVVCAGGPKVFGRLRSASRGIYRACCRFGKRILLEYIQSRFGILRISQIPGLRNKDSSIVPVKESCSHELETICWDDLKLAEVENILKHQLLRLYQSNLDRIARSTSEADESEVLARSALVQPKIHH